MDLVFLNKYDDRKDFFQEYITKTYRKVYSGLFRSNGRLIIDDHIEPMKIDMENLLLNFNELGIPLVETHDFEDFFFDRGFKRERKLINIANGLEIKGVINPYDRRIHLQTSSLSNYLLDTDYKYSFNYLIKNSGELGDWLCYCLFKTTKMVNEDSRRYNNSVLSQTPNSQLNSNITPSLKHFLDIMVVLEKLTDIKSNNSDPFEISLNSDLQVKFKAKKLRNSLEKKFIDLPNIDNFLKKKISFKFQNKPIYNYKYVNQMIFETENSINQFLKVNAPLDKNILDKVQLGSKVNRYNYKFYENLLLKLYDENNNLFEKKPNLEQYFK